MDSTWADFFRHLLVNHGVVVVVFVQLLLIALAVLLLWLFGKLDGPVKVIRGMLQRKCAQEDCELQPSPDVDLTVRQINTLVLQGLQSLVFRYQACRSYIFEFEEYDARIKPLPWLYCSCTYEYCNQSRRVSCEQDSLQRIPLAAIKYWQAMLGATGAICLHDIDEIKEQDLESWKILAGQQIRSCYCVLLLDFTGKPIGFAGLDYNCDAKSCIKSIRDMEDLKYESIKIAGLLTLKRNGTLEQLAGKL